MTEQQANSLRYRLLGSILVDASGCFLWQRSRIKGGYGNIRVGNGNQYAHRLSYILFRSPIPDGLYVLHSCDVRRCINPSHLFLGTHADNMSDAVSKLRHRHGESSHFAKLEESDVLSITERFGSGDSIKELALSFGVVEESIRNILLGKTWPGLSRTTFLPHQVSTRPYGHRTQSKQ